MALKARIARFGRRSAQKTAQIDVLHFVEKEPGVDGCSRSASNQSMKKLCLLYCLTGAQEAFPQTPPLGIAAEVSRGMDGLTLHNGDRGCLLCTSFTGQTYAAGAGTRGRLRWKRIRRISLSGGSHAPRPAQSRGWHAQLRSAGGVPCSSSRSRGGYHPQATPSLLERRARRSVRSG